MASFLKNLDSFITVSNSTAHLAGALGIKTFNKTRLIMQLFLLESKTNKTPWYKSVFSEMQMN